jgi:predicted GIY-YIG superfamily endonuclease
VTTFLYKLFDKNEELLYVGITEDVDKRLKEHASKPWFHEVTEHIIEPFRNRSAAASIEAEIILTEKPRHNVQHQRSKGNTRTRYEINRIDVLLNQRWSHESLVGSFFYSDAESGWQGCVVAEIASGMYLIELFEWLGGSAGCQKIVALSEMRDWCFYDSAKWMQSEWPRIKSKWDNAKTHP